MPAILPDHRADCLARLRRNAERLCARDRCCALEEFWDAGEINVATAQDHDHSVARDHGNMPKEEGGKSSGASGLHDLLEALHGESQATKDLFVGEGDEAIKE